jgi:hypothetical protein
MAASSPAARLLLGKRLTTRSSNNRPKAFDNPPADKERNRISVSSRLHTATHGINLPRMSTAAEMMFLPSEREDTAAVRYSEPLGLAICKRIAKGETLKSICKLPGMPDDSSVRAWAMERADFAPHYARARVLQAHAWAEGAVDVARDAGAEIVLDEGLPTQRVVRVVTHEAIGHAKLIVDTMKWFASKALPKVYGDKLPELAPLEGRALTDMSIGELETLVSQAQDQLERVSAGVLEHKAGE